MVLFFPAGVIPVLFADDTGNGFFWYIVERKLERRYRSRRVTGVISSSFSDIRPFISEFFLILPLSGTWPLQVLCLL